MRFSRPVLAWVTCALIMSTGIAAESSPASSAIAHADKDRADPPQKKRKGTPRIARCVKFSQHLQADESGIDLSFRNRCGAKVSCTVHWTLECDEDEEPRQRRGQAFELAPDESSTFEASAEACGDDGWQVRDVRWTCQAGG